MSKPWLKKHDEKVIEVQGAKVTVKKISFKDSRNAIKAAVKVNPQTKETEADAMLLSLLRVLAMVKDWELTDENGDKLPITMHTFDHLLDEDFASELIAAVQEAFPSGATEEEKKQ
ncbi:hypothetical protein CHCC5027_3559 [Bacillus paralicheniformis]|uniref:hypothetical protein n=1 Tax=Bacillus paralicheniformis TaxID=1648923 RepID=UPI0011A2C356|nr:hypothetical protein [Bacillus paralicheniformis]TWJ39646.1 hypothetical protein CHCC5027_3559 [Bacillus paralicheniformis]